jgi:hypothetical protein
MSGIFLKPYKPIARRRTDIFTYIVRFLCGCIAGVVIGGFIAVKLYSAQAQALAIDGEITFTTSFYLTVLSITVITGIISAILGDTFWGMFSGKRTY